MGVFDGIHSSYRRYCALHSARAGGFPATSTGKAINRREAIPALPGRLPTLPGRPTLVMLRIPLKPPETMFHCPVGNGMACTSCHVDQHLMVHLRPYITESRIKRLLLAHSGRATR